MRARLLIALACAGCGRFGFDPQEAARTDCETAAPDQPCFALQQPASASWEEARVGCEQLTPPARLAAIRSADDNRVAAELAATIPFGPSDTNTNQRQRMWIGGNSLAEIGTWVWETGAPFEYENWRAGQPGSPDVERCLALLGSQDGAWDDRPCDFQYEAYLCER